MSTQPLQEITIQPFKAGLRGQLIQPSDAEYESARRVYNGMIDKRPALIARCCDVADVMTAVNFARDNGVLLAVRGGGHNGGGLGTCDGGLVIDLARLRAHQHGSFDVGEQAGAHATLSVGGNHRDPRPAEADETERFRQGRVRLLTDDDIDRRCTEPAMNAPHRAASRPPATSRGERRSGPTRWPPTNCRTPRDRSRR